MNVECVKVGSVTYANKARDALQSRGVRSKMKKSINADDGCVYLLEIEKRYIDSALSILRENGISFERCDSN